MNIFTDMIGIITCASFALAWVNNFCISFSYGKLSSVIKKRKANNGDTTKAEINTPPLSVVITAHDQAASLRKNLPQILKQNYPKFEVIVVNNNSTDDTEEVLKTLELHYPHLYHTFTPSSARYISQKRLALTLGFRAARHDWVVLIDADCYPESSDWLLKIASACKPETQIILGYSNYITTKSVLGRFQQYFRLFHQMQYLAWALKHPAYRASGMNMAYRKSFFLQHKGFAGHVNLVNGAEELLVNHNSTPENTTVFIGQNCATRQETPVSSHLCKQELTFYMETRRYFKHKHLYRCSVNWKIFAPWLFCISFFAATTYSILLTDWISTTLFVFLFWGGILLKGFYFNRTARALGESPYHLSLFFYELALLPRNINAIIKHRFSPKSHFHRKIV